MEKEPNLNEDPYVQGQGEPAVPKIFKAMFKGDTDPTWYYGEYFLRNSDFRGNRDYLKPSTLRKARPEEIPKESDSQKQADDFSLPLAA